MTVIPLHEVRRDIYLKFTYSIEAILDCESLVVLERGSGDRRFDGARGSNGVSSPGLALLCKGCYGATVEPKTTIVR
jgi:hypothetical protein